MGRVRLMQGSRDLLLFEEKVFQCQGVDGVLSMLAGLFGGSEKEQSTIDLYTIFTT